MARYKHKAMAAPTFYTDRAAFNAAAGSGLSFESFEDAFTPAESVDFGDFTFTEHKNNIYRTENDSSKFDVATDGQYALSYLDFGSDIGIFSFSDPIIAFGIDITTDTETSVKIHPYTSVKGGDVSQSIAWPARTPKFWGVIDSDGITDVTFDADGGFYNIYFDSLSYVLPSEQPSSIPSEAPSVSEVPSTEVSLSNIYCICGHKHIPKF